ncbi:phospholipase d1, putative [Ichthyophthirius multifiliis]|uniref:Phospholipase n=1 Tax=Ichthyophthirius multifiliis TaxID=5932 RepID=G0R1A9_ICHMU|nr:phospholipase d1, putative [Ichthyophthirius multifiliis]EGR28742.1 phospholipase d1, putative [Ichthyophthirius multifiliis]|eukprot:XP_004029978.1 phospholipase d1, putative [Ichthyophthirius multifiliis]
MLDYCSYEQFITQIQLIGQPEDYFKKQELSQLKQNIFFIEVIDDQGQIYQQFIYKKQKYKKNYNFIIQNIKKAQKKILRLFIIRQISKLIFFVKKKIVIIIKKKVQKQINELEIYDLQLPTFPKQENEAPAENLLIFFNQYFNQYIFKNKKLTESYPVRLFLEISRINHYGHQKYKEQFMKKKAGGRSNENRCVRCGVFWGKWNKRYFCITSDGISISKDVIQEKCQIREVIMFDYDFSVEYGKFSTGYNRGISINSSNRRLLLEACDLFSFFDFLFALKQAMQQSPYLGIHRFASYSPEREKNDCVTYVDGEDYFKELYKCLKKAEREIFITDWWLSPQFYLVRPVGENENNQTRIDLILSQKSRQGIKIYIIVYREPKIALTINSQFTKYNLINSSSAQKNNIKILRHPSTLYPFMWSHHEKMVIIDQKIGFMGGLDICYGRMDNSNHFLYDYHEINGKNSFWPGIDYCNSRMKDFQDVKIYNKPEIDKSKDHRMPWHDVAIKVKGKVVTDMTRHFIQYWNFAQQDLESQKGKEQYQILRIRQQSMNMTEQKNTNKFFDKVKNKWEKFKHNILNRNDKEVKKQIQFQQKQAQKAKQNINNNKNIKNKKIGSHSECISYQNSQLDEQYIKILEEAVENKDDDIKNGFYQQKSSQQEQNILNTQTLKLKKNVSSQSSSSSSEEDQNEILLNNLHSRKVSKGTNNCQMLRSSSIWSCGIKDTECSIHMAYIHLIGQAQHFIYIENQFFISNLAGEPVTNNIALALVARIKQAFLRNEKFRVFVVLPLLPGFQGEIDGSNSGVLKIQLHWEYLTICRGGNSIYETLQREGISDPEKYISFYGLRTHAKKEGCIPVTEIVYVHSKLMIVDDKNLIIGSANINDRSMKGSRDSEIAMFVQDQDLIESKMNGKQYMASKVAFNLRIKLFQEHFGLSFQQLIDPLSEDMFNNICQNCKRNTEIYREVFRCYPDDNIKTSNDFQDFQKTRNLDKYDQLKNQIVGFAVEFPKQFLQDENLELRISQREYFCPSINFT